MKTKIFAIFISFLLSVPCHARKKDKTHFSEVDAIRRANHQWATNEIQDLNTLREKIFALTGAIKSVTTAWNDISKQCKGSPTGNVLISCHGQIGILASSSNLYASQLEVLAASSLYQELVRRPSPKSVNFEVLVADSTTGFRDFSRNASELRQKMGVKVAAEEFQQALARMNEADLKVRTDVQCRLMPPLLGNKLIKAALLQREAHQFQDAHRLLQSQLMAKEVSESAGMLLTKCPAEMTTKIQTLQARALDTSEKVLMSEVQSLAAAACQKIGNSDGEIEASCRDTDYSPSLLYSMHRKLEQKRKTK